MVSHCSWPLGGEGLVWGLAPRGCHCCSRGLCALCLPCTDPDAPLMSSSSHPTETLVPLSPPVRGAPHHSCRPPWSRGAALVPERLIGSCLALRNLGALGHPSPYPAWLLKGQKELRANVLAGEADVGGKGCLARFPESHFLKKDLVPKTTGPVPWFREAGGGGSCLS